MKKVQIRSFSGSYFPVLGLNTEIYSVKELIPFENDLVELKIQKD